MRSSLAPDMHVGVGCRKGSPYAKNRCGPDTPGGVSLREFFGIMRIELSLHGRAVGLRPPLRENSEFLSAGHLASGILDMV